MSDQSLSITLAGLYDQVLQFTDECAFYCEAYAALALQNEGFDTNTASGISMSAHVLKQKAIKIQQQVRDLHDLAQARGSDRGK